jgi:hypothetical protein
VVDVAVSTGWAGSAEVPNAALTGDDPQGTHLVGDRAERELPGDGLPSARLPAPHRSVRRVGERVVDGEILRVRIAQRSEVLLELPDVRAVRDAERQGAPLGTRAVEQVHRSAIHLVYGLAAPEHLPGLRHRRDRPAAALRGNREHVWDAHLDPFSNTVAVTIARLRRKLGEPPLIETVIGAGYRL